LICLNKCSSSSSSRSKCRVVRSLIGPDSVNRFPPWIFSLSLGEGERYIYFTLL
jgi:hypothetical protein